MTASSIEIHIGPNNTISVKHGNDKKYVVTNYNVLLSVPINTWKDGLITNEDVLALVDSGHLVELGGYSCEVLKDNQSIKEDDLVENTKLAKPGQLLSVEYGMHDSITRTLYEVVKEFDVEELHNQITGELPPDCTVLDHTSALTDRLEVNNLVKVKTPEVDITYYGYDYDEMSKINCLVTVKEE